MTLVNQAVVVIKRKKKHLNIKSHNSSSNAYKFGYSMNANGFYDTSSATSMLTTGVEIYMTNSLDKALNNPSYSSFVSTFTPTTLTSPASLYDSPQAVMSNFCIKSAPMRTTMEGPPTINQLKAPTVSTNKFPPSAPTPEGRTVPTAPPKTRKPLSPSNLNSASKPSVASRPSTNGVKRRVPVPMPKPKLKPLVPAKKTALELNEIVSPKHTVKPARQDTRTKKPLFCKNSSSYQTHSELI